MVYLATRVLAGSGIAMVTATGSGPSSDALVSSSRWPASARRRSSARSSTWGVAWWGSRSACVR